MAKMKLKKKAKDEATAAAERTPGNSLTTPHESAQEWKEEGGKLYKVELEGVKQGAIIPAGSKAEAKERFCELFGITSTERRMIVEVVDEDHGYHVDVNGVIDFFFDLASRKKPKQDSDSDD